MGNKFEDIFAIGGHANSLGRSEDVLDEVLNNRDRLPELYDCISYDDAWVRMRAIDTLEKLCRAHPEWIEPYIDNMLANLCRSSQASIRWHLAQILKQVRLSASQKKLAIGWLEKILSDKDNDWIVASYSMDTLAEFSRLGYYPTTKLICLLNKQKGHKSKAVIKRANKLHTEFTG